MLPLPKTDAVDRTVTVYLESLNGRRRKPTAQSDEEAQNEGIDQAVYRMSNIAGVPATYPSVEDPSDSFLSRASITSDFSLNESTACFLFDDALLRAMVLLRMAIKPGHPADSSDSYSSLLLSSVITIHFFMEMVAAFGYNGGGSLASASVSFAWQLVKTIGLSCFYSESCAIRSFRSGAMCVHSDHLYFLL
ncbi:hypothetical protein M513_00057 [Trichuris suis]|uniref:Uncharacterized protein n=1 Tax=Trichuris suis TaxID=68888 RepID=A0A085MNU8_9BILA|nr:hypothetical protein M513_00057 [Trichuris suis]